MTGDNSQFEQRENKEAKIFSSVVENRFYEICKRQLDMT